MGYVYKKKWKNKETKEVYEGHTWWIKYYRNGKAYRESTQTDKKTKAEMLLKQREGDIAQGKMPGVHFDKVLFDDLARDFITDYKINNKDTLQKAERSVRYLGESFSGVRVTDISTDRIRGYIENRIKKGLRNASINRELAALKRMFHLGKQAKKVNEIPHIPMLTENNVRTGYFEYPEFVAVRDALPTYLRTFMSFAYYTGYRVNEIRNLTWDRVNLVEKSINLTETKNDEDRTLFMNDELITEMRGLHSNRRLGCPYVFQRDGNQIKDFRSAWKNACIKTGLFIIVRDEQDKEIKVPSKIFHDLRRTAVRDMVRSGIRETVAMRISGHKTRSVFDRYNILDEKDLQEAAMSREAYLKDQRARAIPLDTERGELKQFGNTVTLKQVENG